MFTVYLLNSTKILRLPPIRLAKTCYTNQVLGQTHFIYTRPGWRLLVEACVVLFSKMMMMVRMMMMIVMVIVMMMMIVIIMYGDDDDDYG